MPGAAQMHNILIHYKFVTPAKAGVQPFLTI
jgi:hypothetical protein